MDQIGSITLYKLVMFVNYFLKLILALKEKDLRSPSTLKGYTACIK